MSRTKVSKNLLAHSFGQCQLRYTSVTRVTLVPCDGDKITIQGKNYSIPAAGVYNNHSTSATNYRNGVGSSSLIAATEYYVSVFNNAGTLTLCFWDKATGHSTDTTAGNEGVEIITGHPDHTLVGWVRTDGSGQFIFTNVYIWVRTWFNDNGAAGFASLGVDTGLSQNTWTAFSVVSILCWNRETCGVYSNASIYDSVTSASGYVGLYLNSALQNAYGLFTTAGAGYWSNAGAMISFRNTGDYLYVLNGGMYTSGANSVLFSNSHIAFFTAGRM